MYKQFFLLFLLVVSMGLKAEPELAAQPKDNSDVPIGSVHTEDVDVSEATNEARNTVGDFVAALTGQKKVKSANAFGVKVLIEEDGAIEHMWLTHLKYADDKFTGVIGNPPQRVKNVKIGQMMTVHKYAIIDWAYIDGGVMQGNFTVKALFPHMNPIEVKRVKDALGW